MAKKIVDEIKGVLKSRKKEKECEMESKVYDYSETYGAIDMVKQGAYEEIAKLNERIDRIILAHESCKTLKGL